MASELGKVTDVVVVGSLDEAVTSACEIAISKGVKVVLLSPASSSFDAFRDFEERGERFESAVLKEAERRRK
jgi:UDP-N-acetylmuramoylalanine--D-glutamate ligase